MKVVIVSGFFNPLHGGHLDMIEAASALGNKLVVIVNNDAQQIIKKGKIILPEINRARLMNALKLVDDVIISLDQDSTVIKTLGALADMYPHDQLIFANGGDRDSEKAIPEGAVAHERNIELLFGVGGMEKADSSTRINQANGHDK